MRLIDLFFRALGFLAADATPTSGSLLRSVRRILLQPDAAHQSLATLARRIGYHPDHLNRLLKQACGLTLGEYRSVARLQTARRLLSQARPVSEVAAESGFDDPNYFARWFRAQTGYTLTAWRWVGKKPLAKAAKDAKEEGKGKREKLSPAGFFRCGLCGLCEKQFTIRAAKKSVSC